MSPPPTSLWKMWSATRARLQTLLCGSALRFLLLEAIVEGSGSTWKECMHNLIHAKKMPKIDTLDALEEHEEHEDEGTLKAL